MKFVNTDFISSKLYVKFNLYHDFEKKYDEVNVPKTIPENKKEVIQKLNA